jgi:alginate O-acetyltransferase complex protein AlgI
MVFSSITFLFYFLPIVLIVYSLLKSYKLKNAFLFFASLFFYAWGEPIYIILMIFSTLNDFMHGKYIYKYRENKKISTTLLVSSIIINLGLLGFFKYSDFLIMNINNIFNANIELLNLALPIGISFYTFQTMSYSIDIYRGKALPQKNVIDFGMFVTLFPQLIAGPIVKYTDVEAEMHERTSDWEKGISKFIIGLSKKVLIANVIGEMFTINTTSLIGTWFSLFCFAIQIYFDFSGYSDMAIGLGYILGFKFPKNFNHPYISKSISEFWRRWHMTLGSWFREYVYIPLGGNRCSTLKQIRNICIVWFLTGFWHGAYWNYIIWGIYFGAILLLEKFVINKVLIKLPAFLQHIYSLFLIMIGWAIFAIEDIEKLGIFIKSLFSNNILIDFNTIFNIGNNIVIIIIAIIACTPLLEKLWAKVNSKVQNIVLIGLLLVCVSFLIASSYNPFLYFRF